MMCAEETGAANPDKEPSPTGWAHVGGREVHYNIT